MLAVLLLSLCILGEPAKQNVLGRQIQNIAVTANDNLLGARSMVAALTQSVADKHSENPLAGFAFLLQCDLALRDDDLPVVESACAEAMRRDPSLTGRAHVFLGQALLQNGEIQTAIPYLRSALDSGSPLHQKLAQALELVGEFEEAEMLLQEIVAEAPDASALSDLGAVLLKQNKLTQALQPLRASLRLRPDDRPTIAHFIQASTWLGHTDEAKEMLEDAVVRQLWTSIHQYPGQFDPTLPPNDAIPARAMLPENLQQGLDHLETVWPAILAEATAALASHTFKANPEGLHNPSLANWDFREVDCTDDTILMDLPATCGALNVLDEQLGICLDAAQLLRLQGGAHIRPHCGPHNFRWVVHLGLVTPKGPVMRVTQDYVEWNQGKCLVFDDSFEHEVHHHGTDDRLILALQIEKRADLCSEWRQNRTSAAAAVASHTKTEL